MSEDELKQRFGMLSRIGASDLYAPVAAIRKAYMLEPYEWKAIANKVERLLCGSRYLYNLSSLQKQLVEYRQYQAAYNGR